MPGPKRRRSSTALAEAQRQIEGLVAQLRPAAARARSGHGEHAMRPRAAHGQAAGAARAGRAAAGAAPGASWPEPSARRRDADLVARSAARCSARSRRAEHAAAPAARAGAGGFAGDRSSSASPSCASTSADRAAALRDARARRSSGCARASRRWPAAGSTSVWRARGGALTSWSASAPSTAREVEALELLLRVLRDAERDAKERYVGPLARRHPALPAGAVSRRRSRGRRRLADHRRRPRRAAPSRSSG